MEVAAPCTGRLSRQFQRLAEIAVPPRCPTLRMYEDKQHTRPCIGGCSPAAPPSTELPRVRNSASSQFISSLAVQHNNGGAFLGKLAPDRKLR